MSLIDRTLPPPQQATYTIYKLGNIIIAEPSRGSRLPIFSGEDAAAVIQSAIDALPATGGVVFIKAGLYILSTYISARSNLTLLGEGIGKTVLKLDAGRNTSVVRFYLVDRVWCEGITFDQNGANNTGTATAAFWAGGLTNSVIRNCEFKNPYYKGFSFNPEPDNVIFENNIVDGGDINTADLCDGIPKNMVVRNNIFRNSHSSATLAFAGKDTIIQGNLFVNNKGYAEISLEVNLRTEPARGMMILDNVIHDCVASNAAIYTKCNQPAGLVTYDLVVRGNVIRNVGSRGIWLSGVYRCVVEGNVIEGHLREAIMVDRFQDLVVSGNSINSKADDVTQGNGIVLAVNGRNFTVVGNAIYDENANCNIGIICDGVSAGDITDGVILGNTIRNMKYRGVWLSETTYVSILENVIRNCPTAGIDESTNCDYNIIELNDLRGLSNPIVKTGANTIVKNNKGYVTENSGTATILAGSTYIDVSHGLSITPDINKIKVTPKDNLGGRSFWISDVGAATFRINISSTDTVDHVFGWCYG